MADESLEQQFNALKLTLKAVLKPWGYTKQGQRFRRLIGGNAALIEVQRSSWNDGAAIRLTINVCVISSQLAGSDIDIKKAGGERAQLRERIGFFLPDPHDKWWELNGTIGDAKVADEIVSLIIKKVLPFLNNYTSDQGLAELWKSGRSPGITEVQRLRYLEQLRSAA